MFSLSLQLIYSNYRDIFFSFGLFHRSDIGEGNGNPLQCSCLENPRDSRAWLAAVYGVAQSLTQLKQLSSSSIGLIIFLFLLKHIKNSLMCLRWTMSKLLQIAEKLFLFKTKGD